MFRLHVPHRRLEVDHLTVEARREHRHPAERFRGEAREEQRRQKMVPEVVGGEGQLVAVLGSASLREEGENVTCTHFRLELFIACLAT